MHALRLNNLGREIGRPSIVLVVYVSILYLEVTRHKIPIAASAQMVRLILARIMKISSLTSKLLKVSSLNVINLITHL